MPAPDDDLVTAEQAAKIIGKTRRTVSRWAESGLLPTALQLPSEHDKGARLFRRTDVEALREQMATAS